MSQIPPPPDDTDPLAALIDQGGRLTGWFIGEILTFLSPGHGKIFDLRFLRWVARHYLTPAETVLRRAIHLIADILPPLAQAETRPAHPGAGTGTERTMQKARAPLFRFTEPRPRLPTDYIPLARRPRIPVAGITLPGAALARVPANSADLLEGRVRRRLAALEAAWDDPWKAAIRLQRLRLRGRLKSPVLSFVQIPGGRANTLNDVAAPILHALNEAASDAAARRADTS